VRLALSFFLDFDEVKELASLICIDLPLRLMETPLPFSSLKE